MGGIIIGSLIGLALTLHRWVGILSIGSVTMGVVLILNAPKEKKFSRALGVCAAVTVALWVYWYHWEDTSYLLQIILEDFQ